MVSEVNITPYRADDEAFICDSWKKSYRNAKPVRKLTDNVYYPFQERQISRIFERSPVILVARKAYELDGAKVEKIIGWIVGEDYPAHTVIHYVYVKKSHRREKVAKRLLASALTHLQDNPLYFTYFNHNYKLAERKGFRFLDLEAVLHAA